MKPFKQYRKLKLIGVRKNTGQFSIPKSLLKNRYLENVSFELRYSTNPLVFKFINVSNSKTMITDDSLFGCFLTPSFTSGQLNLTISSRVLKEITIPSHRLFSLEVTPLEFRFTELSVQEVEELEKQIKPLKSKSPTKQQLSEFHDPEDTFLKKKVKEIEDGK